MDHFVTITAVAIAAAKRIRREVRTHITESKFKFDTGSLPTALDARSGRSNLRWHHFHIKQGQKKDRATFFHTDIDLSFNWRLYAVSATTVAIA